MVEAYNPNPTVLRPSTSSSRRELRALTNLWDIDDSERDTDDGEDADELEEIDQDEIFDLIRHITDPEHKHMSLEQLMVVSVSQCTISNPTNRIGIEFTPTVPHCGMSTLIGLSLRVRLIRALPSRFKIDVKVKPGSHQSENELNKQLNDKERVAAALENNALLGVIEECLEPAQNRTAPSL